MATPEELAKVDTRHPWWDTQPGKLFSAGKAGAMNGQVAGGVRSMVADTPGAAFAADAAGQVRQAYREGGALAATGQALGSATAAPLAVGMDIGEKYIAPVQSYLVDAAKTGLAISDRVGRGMVGDFSPPAPVSAPAQVAPVATGTVAAPAPTTSPQIQTAPSHGAGIRTVAQPQAPVEEGGGMIRDSQTGEVVRMDPAGNISRFDSTGAPISKLSARQWGGAAQQAPAPRGLTVTNPDGTTEFVPASTEQAPPVWGLRPAAQDQAQPGYTPREIKTWGDWMTEKKERAAYGLNTARMAAEAGATKQLVDAGQVATEGESVRGLRAAQKSLAEAQATNVPKQTEQLGEYYKGVVEASKDKNAAAAEAAKSKTNAKIVQMPIGPVDVMGVPTTVPSILNPDGTATPVTPAGLNAKNADLHASLDDKKKAQVAAKFGKRTNVDPMELHDFLRKLSTAEDK